MADEEPYQIDGDFAQQESEELRVDDNLHEWHFVDFSDEGAEYHPNLPGRRAEDVHVEYEASDFILLKKYKNEQKKIAERIVDYLSLETASAANISPLHCFAAALPQAFLVLFTEWLEDPISLEDVLGFLRFEIHLRYYNISAKKYASARDKYDNDMATCYDSHRLVRARMSKVDVPNSSKDTGVKGTHFPPLSIDPVVPKLQQICREHWVKLFFVKGETWLDLDDDKLPHHAKRWETYGIRLRTTRDMVAKPVVHLLVSVSNGFIIGGWLEERTSKLNEIVKDILLTLFRKSNLLELSVSELRDMMFFIDRGYIILSKEQKKDVRNLLQILLEHGAAVLCTCRMNPTFPFQTLFKTEGDRSGRPQIQLAGKRSAYIAERVYQDKEKRRSQLSALVFRQGMAKARAGLLVTNVKSLRGPSWVYEISKGHQLSANGRVRRVGHVKLREDEDEYESEEELEEQAFRFMEASIYRMTLAQRTQDWFLARMFRTTSTSVFKLINCKDADYFYPEMKEEHEKVKQAAMLNPRVTHKACDDAVIELATPGKRQKGASSGRGRRGDAMKVSYWTNNRDKATLVALAKEFGLSHMDKLKKSEIGEAIIMSMCSGNDEIIEFLRKKGQSIAAIDLTIEESHETGMLKSTAVQSSTREVTDEHDEDDDDSDEMSVGRGDDDDDEMSVGRGDDDDSEEDDGEDEDEGDESVDDEDDDDNDDGDGEDDDNNGDGNSKSNEPGKTGTIDDENGDGEQDNDNGRSKEPTPEERKLCFLRHVMPKWFMSPIHERSENMSLRVGSISEEYVRNELPGFLEKNSEYRVMHIRDYGLVCSRTVEFASASPDGVCSLARVNTVDQSLSFARICAIEIKTSTTTMTETSTHDSDSPSYFSCDVGTEDFQKHITNPSYRSQTIHHAAVLGLENVLVVFASRTRIVRCVMVHVPFGVRDTWLKLLKDLQARYMGFVFHDKRHRENLPRLGPDGSGVYGYAVDHHTVDTYIKLWTWHRNDVKKYGTPPPCSKLLPRAASTWNHFMGNVDTVRKVASENAAVSSHLGPTSLVWMTFFNYVLYNAFRLFQLTNVSVELVDTFEKLKQQRKTRVPFGKFLDALAQELKRDGSELADYLPLLQQIERRYNRSIRPGTPPLCARLSQRKSSSEQNLPRQRVSLESANSKEAIIRMRLDGEGHIPTTEPGKRARCIVCCEHCLNRNGVREHKYRSGSKTVVCCKKCNVFLCKPTERKQCFTIFHTQRELPLPPCQLRYVNTNNASE